MKSMAWIFAVASALSPTTRRAALELSTSWLICSRAAAATEGPRERLLEAVAKSASQSSVEELIVELAAQDPSGGRGAEATGAWKLLWSARTLRFSPLLELPKPLRPVSEQYLDNGIRNTLRRGILGPAELVLSADKRTAKADTVEILPPFSLRLRVYGANFTLVDANSDASFRATQARSLTEQRAPRNQYKQLYLDTSGRPGDLRISTVVEGDPVIVGAVFIHQRL